MLIQGGQRLPGQLSRQLCYPSLSRGHFLGVRCLRHVSLQRSDNPASRFPPPGPPDRSSPVSTVLSGRYDFLPSVSPHFVAFVWRYHPKHSCFAHPAAKRCRRRVSWSCSPGDSGRETVGGDDRISYVPGEPVVLLPCSPTPAGPTHQALTMRRRGPRNVHDEGSHENSFRGSITRLRHWLSTLRRPGRPDTTQDSLPAAGQALPDGLGYPQGSNERFQGVSYIYPPFPSST